MTRWLDLGPLSVTMGHEKPGCFDLGICVKVPLVRCYGTLYFHAHLGHGLKPWFRVRTLELNLGRIETWWGTLVEGEIPGRHRSLRLTHQLISWAPYSQ